MGDGYKKSMDKVDKNFRSFTDRINNLEKEVMEVIEALRKAGKINETGEDLKKNLKKTEKVSQDIDKQMSAIERTFSKIKTTNNKFGTRDFVKMRMPKITIENSENIDFANDLRKNLQNQAKSVQKVFNSFEKEIEATYSRVTNPSQITQIGNSLARGTMGEVRNVDIAKIYIDRAINGLKGQQKENEKKMSAEEIQKVIQKAQEKIEKDKELKELLIERESLVKAYGEALTPASSFSKRKKIDIFNVNNIKKAAKEITNTYAALGKILEIDEKINKRGVLRKFEHSFTQQDIEKEYEIAIAMYHTAMINTGDAYLDELDKEAKDIVKERVKKFNETGNVKEANKITMGESSIQKVKKGNEVTPDTIQAAKIKKTAVEAAKYVQDKVNSTGKLTYRTISAVIASMQKLQEEGMVELIPEESLEKAEAILKEYEEVIATYVQSRPVINTPETEDITDVM